MCYTMDDKIAMDKNNEDVDKHNEMTELEDWSFVGELAPHDLTLIVEEHKIYVSKDVLCVASPVFRVMLQSDFAEINLQEIKLPGKKYEDIAEFLRWIYPDKLKYITVDNVYQVLPSVMEYQVIVLQERCQILLVKIVQKKPGDVFEHIGLAELYSMEALRRMCVYIASEASLECFENTTVMISAKTLFQIHLLNMKRRNLDRADDKMLFENEAVKITKQSVQTYSLMASDTVVKTVYYRDIIQQYLNQTTKSPTCEVLLRYVRLSYRYKLDVSQQQILKLKEYINQTIGTKTEKELSLLPEHVKQSIVTSADMQQYFYPPLPVVPKPETGNVNK